MSHDLLKVELNIVPGSLCNDSFNAISAKLKYGILNDRMICATPLEGTSDVSAVYLFFKYLYLHTINNTFTKLFREILAVHFNINTTIRAYILNTE